MKDKNPILVEMIKGYGQEFPPLEELFSIQVTEEDLQRLRSPIPALGRYLSSVEFLQDVTSAWALGRRRFRVIIEYFIALSGLMATYKGPYRKVIGKLTEEDIDNLRMIGTPGPSIIQAEAIEKFTEHDTAAAVDLIKLKVASLYPHLAPYAEGFHFACTSEDVMSIVFGGIANELVYFHFMNRFLNFCDFCIRFAENHRMLVVPALTHEQAAEPTTIGKKFANRLFAINELVGELAENDSFKVFSGKLNGAVGNFTTHFAAYPDITWPIFAKKFVESFGLHYEPMTDQCAPFSREAQIFTTIANILTQVIKLTDDFIKMARCPAQFFVKKKKKGHKGSSIMPNKSNAWNMEGAIAMFKKAQNALLFLTRELSSYPDEGNMGRSFLMRDLGNDFMPIFIGFDRVMKEMSSYVPNLKKLDDFFREYPGMSGSAIQTVLKRQGVSGDAYRMIQEIAINPNGSYANSSQFKTGLEKQMSRLRLGQKSREELRKCLEPRNLAVIAENMALGALKELRDSFGCHRKRASRIIIF